MDYNLAYLPGETGALSTSPNSIKVKYSSDLTLQFTLNETNPGTLILTD